MEDTQAYLDKLHDTQRKDEKNRASQGSGTPQEKLQTKQHSTDK